MAMMGCGCSRRVAIGVTVWFFTREWMDITLSISIYFSAWEYNKVLFFTL
jgi:hypothetical protein